MKRDEPLDPNGPGFANIRSAFESAGLPLGKKKRSMMPYTLLGHQLLDYAAKQNGGQKQNEVSELLFKALFQDTKNLEMKDVLEVAKTVGFDVKEVEKCLKDEEYRAQIKQKATSWSREGISGVPFFFMNGKPAFSGAQDVDTFKKSILRVAEKFPLETASKA